MVDFVALVPARLASTRFPRKVLAPLAGRPLVVHCAERARASGAKRVAVATDHPEVAEVVLRAGFEAILTSPDHQTGTDRLAEAVARLGLDSAERVVNVQGDEPLIDPAAIRAVAQRLEQEPDCALATAAYPIRDWAHFNNPNAVKVVLDHRDRALYFSRSPIPWPRDAGNDPQRPWPANLEAWHHLGLYAYRVSFLQVFDRLPRSPLEGIEALEQLRALWHGYPIAVVKTRAAPAPGVDTPEDLIRVEALLAAQTHS